jgi:hypothetical protein
MEDSLYSRKKHRWSLILVPQYRLGSDLELQRQSWLMGSNELLRCVRLIELWSSLLVLNMLLVLLDSVWYIGKRWTGLDNFFVKLFRYLWTVQKSVFVLWEIFVPLKKSRTSLLNSKFSTQRLIKVNIKIKIKIIIIIVLNLTTRSTLVKSKSRVMSTIDP